MNSPTSLRGKMFLDRENLLLRNWGVLDESLLRLKQNKPYSSQLLEQVRESGDKALQQPLFSVLKKEKSIPGAEKNDYVSLAKYWWPNPDSQDGLPYVRRDGEINPEVEFYDAPVWRNVCNTIDALAWCSLFTGDPRYGENAVKRLEVWFTDEETGMTPHLNFAQGVPGICDGRGIGIIEFTPNIPFLLDSIILLSALGYLHEEQRRLLDGWMEAFYRWLLTSENGIEESRADSNHGTYYDVLVIALARYLGETEKAREIAEAAKNKRLAVQIEPDGSQPVELKRTLSFNYTMMNTSGFVLLARLAEPMDVDLWTYETEDHRSIAQVIRWFLPYLLEEKVWSYPQINPFSLNSMKALVIRVAERLHDPQIREVGERFAKEQHRVSWRSDLFYKNPHSPFWR